MQSLQRESDTEAPRARYLPRNHLYARGEDMRRMAAGLFKDADDANDEQATVLRAASLRLVEESKRLDEQADRSPAESSELPFG